MKDEISPGRGGAFERLRSLAYKCGRRGAGGTDVGEQVRVIKKRGQTSYPRRLMMKYLWQIQRKPSFSHRAKALAMTLSMS